MTVIENIKTGERWTIEDNQPFPGYLFKVIGNLDNILKEEKLAEQRAQLRELIDKCLESKVFCNPDFLYTYR